jgi:hypothetical protein
MARIQEEALEGVQGNTHAQAMSAEWVRDTKEKESSNLPPNQSSCLDIH